VLCLSRGDALTVSLATPCIGRHRDEASMSETYLTEKDVSRTLKVCVRTVQAWRYEGGGPPFVRISERRIAYRLSDIETWAASRTFASRAAELAQQAA